MESNFEMGIDLVNVSRFKKLPYDKHENFYKKNFNEQEIKYCLKFKEPYQHFAGKFAIKESVKKIISDKINLLDIKTEHNFGKPTVSVIGKKYKFLTSISHENNFVVAIVIMLNTK